MAHVPNGKVLRGLQRCWAGLRLSWLSVVEKVLLSLVVHGSKEIIGKWCETRFPLQGELARCACVPKAVLLVLQKQDALKAEDKRTAWLRLWNHLVSYRNQEV